MKELRRTKLFIDEVEDNMEVFQNYAYYYNAFYKDKNYIAEAKQIELLLKKYGKQIEKIINFGCGTGKHDIELSKLGYRCSGIDMSQVMIDVAVENARQEGLQIDFAVADVRDYEPTEKYDAVISMFHVMSYQNSNEDILSAFKTARKALDKNGLFLFDVWYGPGVLTDKPIVRVKEVQNDRHKLIRIARPVMHDKTNIVDVCYEVFVIDEKTNETKVINEVHHMRYFFRPEIEMLLEDAEFTLIDNLDCQTLGETDNDTWTSYFIAKAK